MNDEKKICEYCRHENKSPDEWPCINCVNNVRDHFEKKQTERLTEYHDGVAVIKGKRYKEAAEKLAMFEDIVDGLTDADILRFETYLKVYCNIDVKDFKGGAE